MPREVGTGFQRSAPLPCQGLRQPCQPCACGFGPVMKWAAGAVGELQGHHRRQRSELGPLTSQGPCQPASPFRSAKVALWDPALLRVACPFYVNTKKYSFLAKNTSPSILFLIADFFLLPPKLAE